MKECSQETLIQKANCLREYYKDDLEMSFPTECLHFSELLKGSDLKNEKYSVTDLLSLMRAKNLQTVFPNIDIALRIFVSMAVSVCSAERSFSALKRIKSYLRSTMDEDRLNSLAILAIESDLTTNIDFESTINDFAARKSRRKPF